MSLDCFLQIQVSNISRSKRFTKPLFPRFPCFILRQLLKSPAVLASLLQRNQGRRATFGSLLSTRYNKSLALQEPVARRAWHKQEPVTEGVCHCKSLIVQEQEHCTTRVYHNNMSSQEAVTVIATVGSRKNRLLQEPVTAKGLELTQ